MIILIFIFIFITFIFILNLIKLQTYLKILDKQIDIVRSKNEELYKEIGN